ncbi:MAG: HAD-IIIA family hydrolase, partial [Acidobacteria bacterium]|nr:HAD-IIIA family hydrolase [Acidobacteriota bacterium]
TNFQLIVVSNQAGVAKGLLKWQDLLSITCKSFEFFQEAGGIDAAFYCLHQPSDACGCRKPKPGLLEQAARYLKIDFRRSFLVGDSASDMLAGAAMGVKTIYLASSPDPNAKASFVTCTLKQAVCWIRGQSQS